MFCLLERKTGKVFKVVVSGNFSILRQLFEPLGSLFWLISSIFS